VEKAGADALAKIRAEHPEISEEDLKIKVSDRVRREEEARKRQAQQVDMDFPYHMDGEQLRPGRPLGAAMFAPRVFVGGGYDAVGGFREVRNLPHHPMPHPPAAPAPLYHAAPLNVPQMNPFQGVPQPAVVPQAGYQNQGQDPNAQWQGWGMPWPFGGLFEMPGRVADLPQNPFGNDLPARPDQDR
jgi:TRIAD3 protein (E3 ubiquitin-protein ligase RNF216)